MGTAERLNDLVRATRSYRRFDESWAVGLDTLRELVELARNTASANNVQPLKYYLACEPGANARIFKHLRWAKRLANWAGPAPSERPAAYIVILGDTEVTRAFGCDHGIAAQTMMLGATARGLGGCIVGSIDKEGLRKALGLAERFEILLVLALGKPAEKVVLEEAGANGDVAYWRDADGVHHVPKRTLDEIIVGMSSSAASAAPRCREAGPQGGEKE